MSLQAQEPVRTAEEVGLIADRIVTAFTTGDERFQREVFSPELAVWHNTDQTWRTIDEVIALIAGVQARCAKITHADVRRSAAPGGYVQESVIHFVTLDGREYASPACIVVTLDAAGRLQTAREYTDPAGLPPLFYEA